MENPRIDVGRIGLVPLPLSGCELEDLRVRSTAARLRRSVAAVILPV